MNKWQSGILVEILSSVMEVLKQPVHVSTQSMWQFDRQLWDLFTWYKTSLQAIISAQPSKHFESVGKAVWKVNENLHWKQVMWWKLKSQRDVFILPNGKLQMFIVSVTEPNNETSLHFCKYSPCNGTLLWKKVNYTIQVFFP